VSPLGTPYFPIGLLYLLENPLIRIPLLYLVEGQRLRFVVFEKGLSIELGQ
tara:strand:+ start:347 stop:499 length:153 start_codon:yes stop_codon:yes gene_type:complete